VPVPVPGTGDVLLRTTVAGVSGSDMHAGRYNICRELKVFGYQTPGGMADLFAIAADRLHPVPEAMSDQAAALVERLATPVHAVRKARDLRGRTVPVLGAGPIGLLVLVAARRAGAEPGGDH
jgi:L-iditol 2-dehydrogenase